MVVKKCVQRDQRILDLIYVHEADGARLYTVLSDHI